MGNDPKLGIAYHQSSDPARDHVVFCEAKWYSDISTKVTHHQHRNQLARVIENAITFQDGKVHSPSRCTVTLITPAAFKAEPRSRLYRYKFDEYREDPLRLLKEFEICDHAMPRRDEKRWSYPDDIDGRVGALRLNWVTFEDLIDGIPAEPLGDEIRSFAASFNCSGELLPP